MSAVVNVVKVVTADDVKSIPWQWVLVIAKDFIPEMGTKSFVIMAAAGMRGQQGPGGRCDYACATRAEAFMRAAARREVQAESLPQWPGSRTGSRFRI